MRLRTKPGPEPSLLEGIAATSCETLWVPTPDGEMTARMKICAGCAQMRYCCAECQKADWKTHRIACRAIQAEWDA